MDRAKFLEIRNTYLTSATPIQSPEYLRGRSKDLHAITDALHSVGRHAFIYGYRGAGKTSLAQTTAYVLQDSIGSPIIISCEVGATFSSVCNQIIRIGTGINPLEIKGGKGLTIDTPVGKFGGQYNNNQSLQNVEINSAYDAHEYIRNLINKIGTGLVIVIDEFDLIQDAKEHGLFASLIKQTSDQHTDVRFIFCGIADSIDKLFKEHKSIFRQMHTEVVNRLPLQPRIDIIENALEALGMKMPDTEKYRIAMISDGFPSFAHLITEKVLTEAFDDNCIEVTKDHYNQGLTKAVSSVEISLKRSYEDAVHRNTKKYEHAIWAVAADKLLETNVDSIWNNYQHICSQLKIEPVTRPNLATKLNQLSKPEYGSILSKPRHANYTFDEKMMRAYARLRAEQQGCELGSETP